MKRFSIALRGGTGLAAVLASATGLANLFSFYPTTLSGNTTGVADSIFTGPPDDSYWDLGREEVTYDFGANRIVNRSGQDFNVYEADVGTPEFNDIDVLVSGDGLTWYNVDATADEALDLVGDEAHNSASYRKSFALPDALPTARYVKIDGITVGEPGQSIDFDLDAIGAYEVLVPEPQTWALLTGIGLGAFAFLRRR